MLSQWNYSAYALVINFDKLFKQKKFMAYIPCELSRFYLKLRNYNAAWKGGKT